MKKSKLLAIVGLALLLTAGGAGCGSKAETEKESVAESAKTDQAADAEQKGESETEEKQAGMFTDLDTTDLEGNPVKAKDLEEHKLTMINIWATWCGPCANEIPELAEIAKEYEKEGEVSIKGLVVETDSGNGGILTGISDAEKEKAQTILDNSNAQYQQLLVSEGMMEYLYQLVGFPTTYFVDKNGNTVGEEVVGARSGDEWKEIIQERLAMLEDE